MTNLQNETMSYTQTHQGKVEVVKRDVEVVKDDLANDIMYELITDLLSRPLFLKKNLVGLSCAMQRSASNFGKSYDPKSLRPRERRFENSSPHKYLRA